MNGARIVAERHGGEAAWHLALSAVNDSPAPTALRGFAAPVAALDPDGLRVLAFASAWGREHTPQSIPLSEGEIVIGSDTGRSANGHTPLCVLTERGGRATAIAVCWSGNWQVRIATDGSVTYGMTETMLSATLAPGQALPLPGVLVAQGTDAEAALRDLMDYIETDWLPPSRLTYPIVEWNHWWRFEDAGINETVFLENAACARDLGFTQCTLDAGWFGDGPWERARGDWNVVNAARFPHGLRYLSDEVHAMGMRFGLWIEPEALGADSALRREHPDWEASPRPCLCLGNPDAAAHLATTLDSLVTETNCDFLKVDFNLDPGDGCTRADHGHEPGLGLYAHLHALYDILDGLRAKHPALVVENCSSGGLRNDLEMLRHVDLAFLSDPDETAHALQVLWGASLLMPPGRMLHWGHSQSLDRAFPGLEYGGLAPDRLRASLRAAMPHRFGMSRDLRTLAPEEAAIVAEEIARYKRLIAPLLGTGRLHRLTGPFLRDGARMDDGRRAAPPGAFAAEARAVCAFQLQADGAGVVLAFAREDAPPGRLRLAGLDPAASYRATDIDTGGAIVASGESLQSDGLPLPPLPSGASRLITIDPQRKD